MRVLPKSLFGRLVLVLLAGIALSQLAALWINQTERDRLLYRAGGLRLAQQVSDIVKLLDSLSGPERRRVAAVFNAPPLTVSLDRPPLRAVADAGDDLQLSAFVSVLRYTLGDDAVIAVARTGAPLREMAMPERREGRPFGMHGERGERGERGWWRRERFAPALTVQVRLQDGTLATFDSSVVPPIVATTLRLALTLAVLLATVVIVSLIAVRWVTGPLRVLADAAEKLGENIHRPPIPETGPVEVRSAARSFNAMQQRLQRSMAERTRLLTAMSHDLKTPITRMRLRTEMLEDEAARPKFERDLAEMEQMVDQTLEFMRDAAESEPVQRVDLMALLESLQTDYEDVGKAVSLEGRISAPVSARPAGLRRCIANLLENAIRYGSRARVEVSEDAQAVTLRVLDEGPGIPEAELERVFEPFVRGEASRSRETGGFGLGLGIARNIARAHGGELLLRNRPEGGLAAILTLPRG